jgi:regulator of protease activity HflC (stomatin/prohibitin superfamily)
MIDSKTKRIFDEGMVTVGHMREQIAAEREACAKLCDEARAARLAEQIRARGETK